MRRRAVLAVLTGWFGLAGCLGRPSTFPSEQTTAPTKETETRTAVRRTADGITATFRIVDSHRPTDDTVQATFDDTDVTVTGTMDPSGCNRPVLGVIQYNRLDRMVHLHIDTESPYGATATVECGNASYDYRCVLTVEEGHPTAIEVVHQYEGEDNRSVILSRS